MTPNAPADAPQFDYIVVGAGTSGCLMANRLSADPRTRVLLIEAGGVDNYLWIHIPVGYLYCIGNPRTDWLFQTEPDPGLNGRRLRYPRGKVLGGCSSINGMIYMRGQSRDYDGWAAALDDPAWNWRSCLPFFMHHEDHWRGADEWHGASGFDRRGARAGGEWRVERQRLSWRVLDAFAEAAQQAGIPAQADFNRGNNEGVGYFEVNQRSGIRWNASKAFLQPVRHRRNLQVWTDAHATQLLLDSGGSGAVARAGRRGAARGGAPQPVLAAREVVLAAGAVGTPQLLQLSGVGPGHWLQSHGVAPRLERPGVGENLQDHLQIRAVFAVRGVRTLNTLANSWFGKAQIGLHYLMLRSGPMSMAPSQLGCFTRSSAEHEWPNVEYHVQPLSLDAFGEPLHTTDAFTASVCNLNPRSRGHVRIRSPRHDDAPAISGQLPVGRRRPPGGRRLAAPDAAHRRHAGAGPLLAARSQAGRAVPER